jgi:hypothetical protein
MVSVIDGIALYVVLPDWGQVTFVRFPQEPGVKDLKGNWLELHDRYLVTR